MPHSPYTTDGTAASSSTSTVSAAAQAQRAELVGVERRGDGDRHADQQRERRR